MNSRAHAHTRVRTHTHMRTHTHVARRGGPEGSPRPPLTPLPASPRTPSMGPVYVLFSPPPTCWLHLAEASTLLRLGLARFGPST